MKTTLVIIVRYLESFDESILWLSMHFRVGRFKSENDLAALKVTIINWPNSLQNPLRLNQMEEKLE